MSEKNRALGHRWFEEIWNQRRTDTIDELMAPDAVGHMEGVETRSPADFKNIRASLLDAFPNLRVVVEAVVADETQVAVRWCAMGTHKGGGLGLAATGRPVVFRGMSWIRIADGKLIEGWDAWNQGKLFAELTAAAKPVAAASKKKLKLTKSPRRTAPRPKTKTKPKAKPAPKQKRRR